MRPTDDNFDQPSSFSSRTLAADIQQGAWIRPWSKSPTAVCWLDRRSSDVRPTTVMAKDGPRECEGMVQKVAGERVTMQFLSQPFSLIFSLHVKPSIRHIFRIHRSSQTGNLSSLSNPNRSGALSCAA